MADITTFVYFHAMRKLGSSPIRSGETSFTDFPYWLCTPLSKAKAGQNKKIITHIIYIYTCTLRGPLVISWFKTPSNYCYNYHKP